MTQPGGTDQPLTLRLTGFRTGRRFQCDVATPQLPALLELDAWREPLDPEPVEIERAVLCRFLDHLAAGDTPSAGGLLAGRSVPLGALRLLLALADGRARAWHLERLALVDGSLVAAASVDLVDAGAMGGWCTSATRVPGPALLSLLPLSATGVRRELGWLCAGSDPRDEQAA